MLSTFCVGDLVEAITKNFVFQPGSSVVQEQIVKILENVVQHKVTKVQAFELAQKLGKVKKNNMSYNSMQNNGVDERMRKYP